MSWAINRDKKHWARMLMILIVIIGSGVLFASRFKIGIDPQVEKCIPGYSVYLIDMKDQTLVKDKTFAFEARGLEPFYKDGTRMVKFLRGVPRDKIEINQNQDITVSTKNVTSKVGWGLPLASKLNLEQEKFMGKTVLTEGQYWFMGSSPLSFDSRYWGTVKHEQIIGRAYPLF